MLGYGVDVVMTRKNTDPSAIACLVAAFVVSNIWWHFLDVSFILESCFAGLSVWVYLVMMAVFVYYIESATEMVLPMDQEEAIQQQIDASALKLAGLALSLSLFATRIGNEAIMPRFIRMIATAFLILLPVLIQNRRESTARTTKLMSQAKSGALLNSVFIVAIAVLVLCTQK